MDDSMEELLDNELEAPVEEEEDEEEDNINDEDLLNMNSSSFRCLAQVFVSSSSLKLHPLFVFPPLEDPGLDSAFYEIEPEVLADEIGVDIYMKMCSQYEVVPIRHVIRSLPTTVLDLTYYSLTLKQIKAITTCLRTNHHVKVLILEDNWMEPEAAGYLAEMLLQNYSITTLNLKECRLGPEGALMLAPGIEGANCLVDLNLSFNSLGDEGLIAISEALAGNRFLKKLSLKRNQLGEKSAENLCEILLYTETIQELDLSWNELHAKLGLLSVGLKENESITNLNLSWNGIGLVPETMLTFAKYLKTTKILENLDLSNNSIGGESLGIIRNGIAFNNSLRWVDLSYNRITPDDACSVARLLVNRRRPLQHISMNCVVTKDFLRTKELIEDMGKEVEIEHVLSNYVVNNPDVRQLLLARVRYIGLKAKTKKGKKDFGQFLFTLPGTPVRKDVFIEYMKEFKLNKVIKDKDLMKHLLELFSDRYGNVDCDMLRKQYIEYYPDTLPPPVKQKKEKKGKRKKKNKKEAPVVVEVNKPTTAQDAEATPLQKSMSGTLQDMGEELKVGAEATEDKAYGETTGEKIDEGESAREIPKEAEETVEKPKEVDGAAEVEVTEREAKPEGEINERRQSKQRKSKDEGKTYEKARSGLDMRDSRSHQKSRPSLDVHTGKIKSGGEISVSKSHHKVKSNTSIRDSKSLRKSKSGTSTISNRSGKIQEKKKSELSIAERNRAESIKPEVETVEGKDQKLRISICETVEESTGASVALRDSADDGSSVKQGRILGSRGLPNASNDIEMRFTSQQLISATW